MLKIDISVPRGWHELSQEQLRFVFGAMSATPAFRWEMVAMRFLSKFCGLATECPYADGWLFRFGRHLFELPADTVADVCMRMAWLSEIPESPVRLDVVDGHESPFDADVWNNLPFNLWISCENLYQGYLFTQEDQLLRQMACMLYDAPDLNLSPAESLAVFYWWASVKQRATAMFPNFFAPAPVNDQQQPSFDDLRRSVDAQIRALTKGDITKEEMVLDTPALRALTELDALAREYDELNRKFPQKS